MDIISQLASQVGLPADTVEKGAGAVLGFIQEQAPAADFQALLSKVPEAASWIGKAGSAATSSDDGGLMGAAGGLLGGLGGALGGLAGGGGALGQLAGQASAASGVLGALSKLGIDPATAARFAPMLLKLLQSKAGADVLRRLASSVPLVREALGATGLGGAR